MTDPSLNAETGGRYCLCSDPDYCLRYSDPAYRESALAYRRLSVGKVREATSQTPIGPSAMLPTDLPPIGRNEAE